MNTTVFPDERLELIFTCCHPALAVEAQVALTLRAVAGLSTDEILGAVLELDIHTHAQLFDVELGRTPIDSNPLACRAGFV